MNPWRIQPVRRPSIDLSDRVPLRMACRKEKSLRFRRTQQQRTPGVGSNALVDFLRESAPMYIYSNPITPAEAAAALKSVEILDSPEGLSLLQTLRTLTQRFQRGLVELGLETIPGDHPIVPLMLRDTERTHATVKHLFDNGVLATGLAFPVVPRGDEEIRFQVNADHTAADIDAVLAILADVP